jgi:glycolate oxidase FAD binding subunit
MHTALAHPHLAHIVEQIRAAAAAQTPLRIRGGGSKDFLADQLQGALLDTTALSGITSYEPSELVITALAGTPLVDIESALAEQGQCLAFEPPHYAVNPSSASTVGGMVAAGLAGPARACVGGVRDYVLGVHMVNGRAEYLQFGGTVIKNVAGYDVSRLMAGSWGMLGVITQVSLKVLPIAPSEATLRFHMDEVQMLHQLNTWAGQPLPLNASSWVIEQSGQELPSETGQQGGSSQGTLYLRLRGAAAAVEAAQQRLCNEAGGQRVDSLQTRADWSAARDLQLPWFTEGFARGDDLWRISVPATTAPLQLGDTMVDWLGAQRWVWAPAPEHADDAQVAQRIRQVAAQANGSATLFVAACAVNTWTTSRFATIKAPLDRIHRQLKAEFDPAGIFNLGRVPWFA